MKRLYSLMLLACLPAALLADEAAELTAARKSKLPEDSAKLALSTSDYSLSTAAFGAFVKMQKTDLAGAESLATIKAFSKKHELFDKTALIVSFHKQSEAVAQALIDDDAPRLGAAVLAWKARARHVRRLQKGSVRLPPKDGEPPKFAPYGSGGRGGKNKKKPGAPGPEGEAGEAAEGQKPKPKKNAKKPKAPAKKVVKGMTIPPALFEIKDGPTLEYALYAAAYGLDPALKERLDEVPAPNAEVFAAKVLYQASQGMDIPFDEVGKMFKACWKVDDPKTQVDAELSNYPLRVPALCTLIEAMAWSKTPGALDHIHRALFHEDLRVQQEAARAIRAYAEKEASLKFVAKRLADAEWPVVVDLCAFAAEHPDKRMVGSLINRLAREKGRLRVDLNYALSSIAGKQVTRSAKNWTLWYKKVMKDFEVDPEVSAAFRRDNRLQEVFVDSLGLFYSIHIYSTQICFVVDSSASMNAGRWTSLTENLNTTVKTMDSSVAYNIIDFGGNVELMQSRGLTTTKSKGLKHVKEMDKSLATRSFDAVERAIWLDKVDTLYFLSDGAPVYGQIDPWSDMQVAITLLNRYRPITINCVAFSPSASGSKAMELFAAENHGHSEDIDF